MNRLRWPPRVAAGTMPMPRPRITGAVSRVRMSPGPRSRIQRAPAAWTRVISSTQSTFLIKMASASSRAKATSRPAFSAQPATMSIPSDSRGV
ncbi:Uncharacterised protein [Mycobacterium tuberculosis]|uniref:Uncharacterized protein n=1 Tax=Mycobacterium tuberculosis TaxID=1773 RepID=A0A654U7N5_MYCTX|nr:Uncharacterised protein [Mycobacterium tuberculosis]COY25313.1 Uncharacterised protein [Mycobacterium tuberculosis]